MSPPASSDNTQDSSAGKCPVDHKNRSLWNVLGMSSSSSSSTKDHPNEGAKVPVPASLEEAAKYAQTPQPDQRLPLSTHRATSTIPRGSSTEKKSPHHQLGSEASTWVYPSEQQVFNAMKRKGWQGIEEESIPSFLQIHNSVNERSWRQLQEWETSPSINPDDIRLVRFQGRPDELTPKAWLWTNVLMQEKPFDRHDWYIDNGVDHEKRYVLDFYMQDDARSGMPRVEIDVRPALDSPSALLERAQRVAGEMFPGIAKEWQRFQQSSSSGSQQP